MCGGVPTRSSLPYLRQTFPVDLSLTYAERPEKLFHLHSRPVCDPDRSSQHASFAIDDECLGQMAYLVGLGNGSFVINVDAQVRSDRCGHLACRFRVGFV